MKKNLTPLFELKDAEMGGVLEKELRALRKKGTPFRHIAAHISQSGRPIHRQTVDNWCKSLGIK